MPAKATVSAVRLQHLDLVPVCASKRLAWASSSICHSLPSLSPSLGARPLCYTIDQVIGDSSQAATKLMKREGVRSVPSFHFWKDGAKVDQASVYNLKMDLVTWPLLMKTLSCCNADKRMLTYRPGSEMQTRHSGHHGMRSAVAGMTWLCNDHTSTVTVLE